MIETTVKVDGMMCGMCEAHVSDAIRGALPVKKVTASHTKGQAVILSEAPLDEEALRAAIGKTGYEVQGVSARPYEKKGIARLPEEVSYIRLISSNSRSMSSSSGFSS